MSLRATILLVTIAIGSVLGWRCGSFGGIMGSYMASIVESSIGLYLGRKIQRNRDGD